MYPSREHRAEKSGTYVTMALKTIKEAVPIRLLLDACRPSIELNPCISCRSMRIHTKRMVHDTCL